MVRAATLLCCPACSSMHWCFDQQTGSCAGSRPSLELTDLLVCYLMPELLPSAAACKFFDTFCPCRTAASSASWPTPSMMSGEAHVYAQLASVLALLDLPDTAGLICCPGQQLSMTRPAPHQCLQLAPYCASHHPDHDPLKMTDCPYSPCQQPLAPGWPAAHDMRLSDASDFAAAMVCRPAGPPQPAGPHHTWPAALQGGQRC